MHKDCVTYKKLNFHQMTGVNVCSCVASQIILSRQSATMLYWTDQVQEIKKLLAC